MEQFLESLKDMKSFLKYAEEHCSKKTTMNGRIYGQLSSYMYDLLSPYNEQERFIYYHLAQMTRQVTEQLYNIEHRRRHLDQGELEYLISAPIRCICSLFDEYDKYQEEIQNIYISNLQTPAKHPLLLNVNSLLNLEEIIDSSTIQFDFKQQYLSQQLFLKYNLQENPRK